MAFDVSSKEILDFLTADFFLHFSVLKLKIVSFLVNSLGGHFEAVDGPYETVVCIWHAFNAIEVNGFCSFFMTAS